VSSTMVPTPATWPRLKDPTIMSAVRSFSPTSNYKGGGIHNFDDYHLQTAQKLTHTQPALNLGKVRKT